MVDRRIMRALLENMERAAEEILQQDSAFYEALLALKMEVDHDPEVQVTIRELKAAGRTGFNSFVPKIKNPGQNGGRHICVASACRGSVLLCD